MIQLVSLISNYGWAAVLLAALIFILLRSEIRFRYPRPPKKH